MTTLVTNLKGTGDLDCRCRSWLEHWEKFANKAATYCSATDCRNYAKHGCHVTKAFGDDKGNYIVPLCDSCNKRGGDFVVRAPLVPANVQLTCG